MSTMRFAACVAAICLLPGCAGAQQAEWTPPGPDLVERARRILDEVPVIDGHNDLPYQIAEIARGDIDIVDMAQSQPGIHTDLARLEAGRVGAQFWAAYVPVDSTAASGAALRHALRQIDLVHRLTERYPDLEFARTADDVLRIQREGRIASMIGVEGGHTIENSLAALRDFHRLGVRYMTLTHSSNTDWADASTDAAEFGGLSPFGEAVVREMNRVGMFVDISHVSAETMKDALRVTEAPVIFSHSSAFALLGHPRNVPDDVLRMVPANGGVVMVNFCPCFIAPGALEWNARMQQAMERVRAESPDTAAFQERRQAWIEANPRPRGHLKDVADHIDHIREVAGIDHIGMGSDFDGIDDTPVGLEDVSTFPVLFAELLRRGYSEEDLQKIAGLNVLRAMREMERTAARLQAERAPGLAKTPVSSTH